MVIGVAAIFAAVEFKRSFNFDIFFVLSTKRNTLLLCHLPNCISPQRLSKKNERINSTAAKIAATPINIGCERGFM
jgi:hypothetical protein